MPVLLTALLTPAIQLALGTVIFAATSRIAIGRWRRDGHSHRRRMAAWTRGSQALCRSLPWLLVYLLVLGGLGRHAEIEIGFASGLFLVLGGLPSAAGYLLLHSGRLEHRGRLFRARRQARFAGRMMAAGIALQSAWVLGIVLLRPELRAALVRDLPRTGMLGTAGWICCGTAALVALLAGLSRKPRPSGGFAVLLYAAGLVGIVAATWLVAGC